MAKYNLKHTHCTICDSKHYARGYCRKHYNNLMAGRQIDPKICSHENCHRRVLVYIEHQLCSEHYTKWYRAKNTKRILPVGGLWGYAKYTKVRTLKKSYCEKCFKGGSLVAHHIDHNKRNHDEKNILTMCYSCHLRHHKSKKIK